jgi:SPX domain protein involved in polyphosphate accumulation
LIRDWEWHYIDYDRLKDLLRSTSKSEWSDDDEQRFVKELESELDKVFTFQKVKSQEIIQRIKAAESEVNNVISKADSRGPDAPTEEDYILLEDDLSEIIADVHDLAKFTQLNYTGFTKIIKKHDKQTKWQLRPVFATRLKAKPFFKDNYDAFIVKLSKLYDLVRTRGNPVTGDSAAGGGQQNFVRQTTKYWVHPDNITELKLIILKVRAVLSTVANLTNTY